MQFIIKLTKEDIKTRPFGNNIAITKEEKLEDNPVVIVFDTDAAIEFAKDVGVIVDGRKMQSLNGDRA